MKGFLEELEIGEGKVKLSKEEIKFKFVGELSLRDIEALIRFVRDRYEMS